MILSKDSLPEPYDYKQRMHLDTCHFQQSCYFVLHFLLAFLIKQNKLWQSKISFKTLKCKMQERATWSAETIQTFVSQKQVTFIECSELCVC